MFKLKKTPRMNKLICDAENIKIKFEPFFSLLNQVNTSDVKKRLVGSTFIVKIYILLAVLQN